MGAYSLVIRPSVDRDVRKIPKQTLRRIVTAMKALANDPIHRGASKLQGADQTYRIRIGDYRVIYEVNRTRRIVNILHVAHRRDVYRGYS